MKIMLKVICLLLVLTGSVWAQGKSRPVSGELSESWKAASPTLFAFEGLNEPDRAAGMAQSPEGSAIPLWQSIPPESRVTIYGKLLEKRVTHVWLRSETGREEVVAIIGVYVQPYFGWEMMSFRLPPGWSGETEVRAESWELSSNVVRLNVR